MGDGKSGPAATQKGRGAAVARPPPGIKSALWRKAVDAALGDSPVDARDLAASWAERVVRLYGHARRYYGLLLGTNVEEAVLQVAEAHPMRYSFQEWVALLQVKRRRKIVLGVESDLDAQLCTPL